jgi:hypothetical protein
MIFPLETWRSGKNQLNQKQWLRKVSEQQKLLRKPLQKKKKQKKNQMIILSV